MKKSILIIGAGAGLSTGVAEKFGAEGYKIGLISRSAEKLALLKTELNGKGIECEFATADATDPAELERAIQSIVDRFGSIDVLLYNAAAMKMKPLMSETVEELAEDFKLSVANAFHSVKVLHEVLKASKGAVLLTGGGFAMYPNPAFGSLSLGKAGIRNLAHQLHTVLKDDGIYVGTLTIAGYIQPDSTTHSPVILADKFWQLLQNRNEVEMQH